MARLVDPVVRAEPQTADSLGHAGRAGADDHRQVRQHAADSLQVRPAILAEHGWIENDCPQLHRHQLLRRGRTGEVAKLPAGGLDPVREHTDETAVVVYDGESDGFFPGEVVKFWRHAIHLDGARTCLDGRIVGSGAAGECGCSQCTSQLFHMHIGRVSWPSCHRASPDLYLRLSAGREALPTHEIPLSSARAARSAQGPRASFSECSAAAAGGGQKVAGRRPVAMIRITATPTTSR